MSATFKLYEWGYSVKPKLLDKKEAKKVGDGEIWSLGTGSNGVEVFALLRLAEGDEIQYELTNPNPEIIVYEHQDQVDKTSGKSTYITFEHACGKRRIIGERNE